MVATTLGSSRDRSYVDRVLFRLRELLLHRLQAFRISGARWVLILLSGVYVYRNTRQNINEQQSTTIGYTTPHTADASNQRI